MAENVQHGPFSLEKRDIEKARKVVENHGVKDIVEHMKTKLNEIENVTVNIAVAGVAGSGKSTFINTIRGIKSRDKGGAVVGCKATTKEPTPYPFPTNANVTLWDIPGFGTEGFEREHYTEKVKLDRYDFFLIFTHKRFTENDAWLAGEVKRQNKELFLVRTHIDVDIETMKDELAETFEESKILDQIREDTNQKLKTGPIFGMGKPRKIYLISALLRDTKKWEFENLVDDMKKILNGTQRQVLSLALCNLSEKLIKEKCDALRARIWLVAGVCGGAGAIPIPIADGVVCGGILQRTVNDYKTKLGLDAASLKRLSDQTGVSYEILVSTADQYLKISVSASTSAIVKHYAARAGKYALSVGSRWIPVLGPVIGASLNFGTTYVLLQNILSDMEKAAIHVVKTVLKFHPT
ncbi:interferon-inducible GTPase 5-like [Lingula anatina]|uniref:Interferon-inducible GTPase 5-like n=1 Tax=Lingula anatina TaxID=7574 RepID=A0A1S3H708_LINAN|nr:interferon-inducible GTPase 5-like [Lingula anatina]|eukprot:XP_013381783.1 interferon-inducible GTPase 5-like [Lingula anatina]